MPFIIVGRERFALPIGETRVGGTGDDALPFPELAPHATMAVLALTPDGETRLAPHNGNGAAHSVTVDGTPVESPVRLRHGARIEAAGVRLLFGDLGQLGATAHVAGIPQDQWALLFSNGTGEPTADSGGRLIVLATGRTVGIPPAGVVIGRDLDCDLVIGGRGVSRRHATIRSALQGYVLTDLSSGGSYVNRRRVESAHVLAMGDVIRIGEEELRFEADAASYEPAPELRPRKTVVMSEPGLTTPLATLEITSAGPLHGAQFYLVRPTAHIGRNPASDVHLTDDSVSGSHATLSRRGTSWILTDLDSTNGTFVDGKRVTGECELTDVAELRLGGVRMTFCPR